MRPPDAAITTLFNRFVRLGDIIASPTPPGALTLDAAAPKSSVQSPGDRSPRSRLLALPRLRRPPPLLVPSSSRKLCCTKVEIRSLPRSPSPLVADVPTRPGAAPSAVLSTRRRPDPLEASKYRSVQSTPRSSVSAGCETCRTPRAVSGASFHRVTFSGTMMAPEVGGVMAVVALSFSAGAAAMCAASSLPPTAVESRNPPAASDLR